MSGAQRTILWRVDADAGVVRAEAVAGGAAPAPHVVHGSAITWIAREHVSARLEPAPPWAGTTRVIGIPVLEEPTNHALTFELNDDVDVNPQQFDALGIHVGALLTVLRDHDVLAAYQDRTEHLIDALRLLPSALTADVLADQLVDAAMRITGATGAALCAWDGAALTVLRSEGGGLAPLTEVSNADSLSVLAARGGATMVRSAATLKTLRIVGTGERFLPMPETAIAVPLATQGQITGVLTVWSLARVEQTAISALETIAPYAAAQLLHARELGHMRSLAERDTLTGLHNRRAFDAYLSGEVARYERYGRPFALIMLDIDHFKKINDTYGHTHGDEAIRRVASLIASSLRDVDFAARYGGEEFAIVLPETSLSRAVDVAERIRVAVEAAQLTVSAGVAAVPESVREAGRIVQQADAALYRSKNGGRNRVGA